MTMHKRIASLLLVLAMLLACMAGCGKDTESGASSGERTASLAAEAAEPIEEPVPVEEPVSMDEAVSEIEVSSAEEPSLALGTGAMTLTEEIEEAAEGAYISHLMDFPYAEETALPVTDENITFSYFFSTQPFMMAYGGEVDYNELTYFKEWSSRTGVGLNLIPVSLMESDTKFQLMIASGDYANMIEGIDGYNGGADAAIDDDVIYDLTDIAAEYMPNFSAWLDSNPNYVTDCSTVDGRLYVAGYLQYGQLTNSMGGILNQNWLDEVGLDVPTTYDEMHEALLGMKNNGHSGAMWMTSALTTVGYTYTAGYDLDIETGFMNKDGTIEYALIENDCKDYLSMLNQWYTEGLVYPDFITIDRTSDTINTGLVTGETVGVYAGQWDTAETMMRDSGVVLTAYPPLRQAEGQVLHVAMKNQYVKGGACISTSVPKEEVPIAAAMMDYLYSKDGVILSNFGVEGEGLQYDEDGNPELSDLVINNPQLPMMPIGLVLYTKYGGPGINFAPREYGAYTDAYWDACLVWNENRDNSYMLPFHSILNAEESMEADNIMTDIETYVEETMLSFVVGDRDIATWDEYVATVEGMGIANAIAIYQSGLDRYLA